MARNVLDGTGWLIEQRTSNVVKSFSRTSVVQSQFRTINMTANIVDIPRITDMQVSFIAKGAAYPEDATTGDVITITAKKVGSVLRIAEEDVDDDKLADYVDAKKTTAGSSYAKLIDNAALGTNAAQNGVVVPFTSLYKAITTADATTGYTASANLKTTTVAAGVTYPVLSAVLGLIEDGDYFDDSDLVWIADPGFRGTLRNVVDTTGRPMFMQDGVVNGREVQKLFDIPIVFTRGARITTTPTVNPTTGTGVVGTTGNRLLFLVQKNAAVFGLRKSFESVYVSGRDGTSMLTDEDLLKVRARVAAGATIPGAHACLELVS